jgi:biotin carboxyl carrier protein
VHAKDRDAAADKLIAYLNKVTITGICTNMPLLRLVLADDVFRKGEYDTDYLPQLLQRTDIEKLIGEINASGGAGGGIDVESIQIDGTDELKVLAPATAIFYSTPSPSEPEYVSVGDVIDLDHTLCQLEAMKIFNPLALKDFNAEGDVYDPSRRYRVTRVNMSNGQQVNVGDLLFVVAPV